MTTLKNLVIAAKCRKGQAKGTTKRGAFWLAYEPILIRKCGGDGIGCQGANVSYEIELRHYRSSEVRVMIAEDSWHQNTGENRECQPIEIGDCTTVEQVICELKGFSFADEYTGHGVHVFSDYYQDKLTEALVALGMPIADPAPDEAITYRVKPEFQNMWGSSVSDETHVTMQEIESCAATWNVDIETLMTQVEKCEN